QAMAEHESTDTCWEKLADSPTPWSQTLTARPAPSRGNASVPCFRDERAGAAGSDEVRRSPNRSRTSTEHGEHTKAPPDREISAKKARTLEISRTAGAGEPQVLGGHVAGTRRHHGGSHARRL